TGRVEAAEAHLRAVVAAAPGDAEAHLNLGVVLLQDGRVSQAATHFERAARAPGLGPEVRAARGAAFEHLARLRGRAGDAVAEHELLLRAVETDPRRPSARVALGVSFARRGDPDS